MDYVTAVRRTLANLETGAGESTRTDAAASGQSESPACRLITAEGMILEQRQRRVTAPPEVVFRPFAQPGGQRGWLYMNRAWRMRGAVVRLVEGVGLRRGRRDPHHVRTGDALDFRRVEAAELGRLLRLGGGDETAGASLAGVWSGTARASRGTAHPDRVFRPARFGGMALLVCALSDPCLDLQGLD